MKHLRKLSHLDALVANKTGLIMKFKTDFFARYITIAPLPLAIERSWECEIQSAQNFQPPILDIGCGEGIFAWNLVDEKIDVGIDPNARELERAKNFELYGELIACFGNAIPKPDKSFQTIFSNSVMEHIPEIEPVLREAHRLLKDDGTVYLTLPTDKFDHYSWGSLICSTLGLSGAAARYRRFFNNFWQHYHYYPRAQWEAMFDRNGFKVKDSFEYGSKAQCLFNDFASPFCGIAFIIKKLTNHWFLFPALRAVTTRLIHVPLFSDYARLKKQPTGEGGLIFFALEKK
jgi:SAM-dependent methyltransferase